MYSNACGWIRKEVNRHNARIPYNWNRLPKLSACRLYNQMVTSSGHVISSPSSERQPQNFPAAADEFSRLHIGGFAPAVFLNTLSYNE